MSLSTSEGGSLPKSDVSSGGRRNSPTRSKWKRILRRKIRQIAMAKAAAASNDENKDPKQGTRGRNVSSLDNAPLVPSPYDDKMKRLLQSNPTLLGNRVHIPWYRRFADVLPDKEQLTFQPFREIQTRDEDIALQHQFGVHECMQDYASRGLCRLSAPECKRLREMAMTRYARIKKREEEKKERDAPPLEENVFTLPGQELDLTTEFGYSANKKKLVCPVVDFLMKLHVNRERSVIRRSLRAESKWRLIKTPEIQAKIADQVQILKRQAARARIRRLFNIVLCVDRFIKCVAMIAGDTQTLLKDTTHKSLTRVTPASTEEATKKELAFFNVHNYQKVGQVQVPFHIQLILSKPWFCRSNKEVETAVRFLEKMRCFTAYPRQFQFMLARVAWYIELPTQKVVIRQSQQAVNFYLLLNGSVRIDRLEGSPCEQENGSFKTLRILSSQDIFGDECITQPFSERWYTATTEEKCAVLDFNMYDYNGMIQTANTSEEAPDHIRFLCKLRIFDSFPKIKLLQEQDDNVTYFFFRPGTLVCKSIRDSPFVFVVRNGSCSTLQELKPKLVAPPKKYNTRKSIQVQRQSSNTPTEHPKRVPSYSKRRSKDETLAKLNVNVYQGIKDRLTDEDKQWFEKTKRAFDKSKSGMKEQVKNFRTKTETLTRTMSTEMLEKFNLEEKPEHQMPTQPAETGGSRKSSLRWKLEGTLDLTQSASDDSVASSIRQPKRISVQKVPNEMVSRKSKIVGTNIPLTPEKIIGESARASMVWSNANTNNSTASTGGKNSSGRSSLSKSSKASSRLERTSTTPKLPPLSVSSASSSRNARMTREQSCVLRASYPSKDELQVPVSRYSQWTQKALLTVTDVAGVEWLDYNDGTYKPPLEDCSLVSHGATIIMIKKEFMLKYLRKVW